MLIIFCLLAFLISIFHCGYGSKVEYDCGVSFIPPATEQIINGSPLEEFEHPWFCKFEVQYEEDTRHCSGVLISGEDVLTSSSCFDDSKIQYKKILNLSCGAKSMVSLEPINVKTQEIFGKHKLALIRIKKITFSTIIRPICMISFEQVLENSMVTVVGSGVQVLSGGEPRKANITVKSSNKCEKLYGISPGREATTVCAGESWIGIRSGDEGAPLMAFHRKRYYLIGIVSLEREEIPNVMKQVFQEYPILYTRVAPYCDTFIHDHSNVVCSANLIPIEPTPKEYSCGAVSESRKTRKRATGEDLNLLQPWYCKISYEGYEICGATLISFKYALTAAHCVRDIILLKKEALTIACGIDFESEPKISKITINEYYVERSMKNDIAIIEFENEIEFNGKVGAACLIDDDGIIIGEEDMLIAVGADEGQSKTVKSIKLNASNYGNCEAELNIPTNSTTALCLESETSTTQKGDSGGPLMKKINGRWHIVGIVSAGSNQHDITKFYLHFSRVSGFGNFITKHTNQGVIWSTASKNNYFSNSSIHSSCCFFSLLLSFLITLLFIFLV